MRHVMLSKNNVTSFLNAVTQTKESVSQTLNGSALS